MRDVGRAVHGNQVVFVVLKPENIIFVATLTKSCGIMVRITFLEGRDLSLDELTLA